MLSKILKLICVFLVGSFLTSCATVSVYTMQPRPEKDKDCEFDIYWRKADVSSSYNVVSRIAVREVLWPWTKNFYGDTFKTARPLICESGAEGVFLESWEKMKNSQLVFYAITYDKSQVKGEKIAETLFLERLKCAGERNGEWKDGGCQYVEMTPQDPRQRSYY